MSNFKTRTILFSTALVAGLFTSGVNAAPVMSFELPAPSDTDVLLVHGRHRGCQMGFVREWGERDWHAHRRGQVVDCEPPGAGDDDDDDGAGQGPEVEFSEGCVSVGPLTMCPGDN